MDRFDKIYEKLKAHNQEHLLQFYNELGDDEKKELLQQIERIDFDFMKELYENKDTIPSENKKIESIPYIKETDVNVDEKVRLSKIGESLLKDGKVAVCQLAGGQGTRLRT